MQRVYVFILGSEVHGSNSNSVHIRVLHDLDTLLGAHILIEQGNCEEVSSLSALEGRGHFDHPVHHLGPVFFANLVLEQRRWLHSILDQQVAVDL